ncbi:hypothetical protein MPSEU_000519800 [Mayamaea pseudoterrestris]|nr:hypothetical protein MPSEU_000519800 [Mayamaea pseudoterrestris]
MLRTPMARGCASCQQKRRMDETDDAATSVNGSDEEAINSLARSLKRVRVLNTSSPGEICLRRDLKYLVDAQGWRQTRDGSYAYENCLLRHGICPSELILYISDVGAQVHLLVPRAYPHRPPKVMPIDYSPVIPDPHYLQYAANSIVTRRVESIVITDELHELQAGVWACAERGHSNHLIGDSAVVLANWTPIRRLGDSLIDIIRILRCPPPVVFETSINAFMAVGNASQSMRGSSVRCRSPTNILPCGQATTEPSFDFG